MKKLFILLPIIFLLTSCSVSAAPVQKSFKSSVTCEYNGLRLKSDVISENHILTVRMEEPEALKGFTYRYKGSKLSITYNGLNLKAEDDYLPDSAFSSVISSVLKAVDRDEINYSGSYENCAEYKGKCKSGDFIITSDYNTGYIKNIKIERLGFSADFK